MILATEALDEFRWFVERIVLEAFACDLRLSVEAFKTTAEEATGRSLETWRTVRFGRCLGWVRLGALRVCDPL